MPFFSRSRSFSRKAIELKKKTALFNQFNWLARFRSLFATDFVVVYFLLLMNRHHTRCLNVWLFECPYFINTINQAACHATTNNVNRTDYMETCFFPIFLRILSAVSVWSVQDNAASMAIYISTTFVDISNHSRWKHQRRFAHIFNSIWMNETDADYVLNFFFASEICGISTANENDLSS